MSRWKRVNTRAGLVVLGLPVLLAVPALVSTVAAFGLEEALLAVAPSILWLTAPLLLWVTYTRHDDDRPRHLMAGGIAAVASVAMLLATPIWFWGGPVLLVLLSETLRLICRRLYRPAAVRAAS